MKEKEKVFLEFIKGKLKEKHITQEHLRTSIVVRSSERQGITGGHLSEILSGDRGMYIGYLMQILEVLDMAIYMDSKHIAEVDKGYDIEDLIKERDFYREKYNLLRELLQEEFKKTTKKTTTSITPSKKTH